MINLFKGKSNYEKARNIIDEAINEYDRYENSIEIFVLSEIHNLIESIDERFVNKICEEKTTWIIDNLEEFMLDHQNDMIKMINNVMDKEE